jgi:hypothetical protein
MDDSVERLSCNPPEPPIPLKTIEMTSLAAAPHGIFRQAFVADAMKLWIVTSGK